MEAEAIIENFDQEVENRCRLIRSNAENVSANLLSSLDLTLLAIPENVRKMPVRVLMNSFGGDLQKASAYYQPMQIQAQQQSLMKNRKPPTPQTIKSQNLISPAKAQTPQVAKTINKIPTPKKETPQIKARPRSPGATKRQLPKSPLASIPGSSIPTRSKTTRNQLRTPKTPK